MELRSPWQRELVSRIQADKRLRFQDRLNRVAHANRAFEKAFEYSYKAYEVSSSESYAKVWQSPERPPWLLTQEDMTDLLEKTALELDYLSRLGERYGLGPLVGITLVTTTDPTGHANVQEDVVRGLCGDYVQSLYDYANGNEEPVSFPPLEETPEEPDAAETAAQSEPAPETAPEPPDPTEGMPCSVSEPDTEPDTDSSEPQDTPSDIGNDAKTDEIGTSDDTVDLSPDEEPADDEEDDEDIPSYSNYDDGEPPDDADE